MDNNHTQILDLHYVEHNKRYEREHLKIKMGILTIDGLEFEIFRGHNVIGRDEHSHITIKNNAISSKHAVIEVEDWDTHLIYDVGSTNKTKLEKVVLKPNVRYNLQDNDCILFANLKAIYHKMDRLHLLGLDDSIVSATESESMLNCDSIDPAPDLDASSQGFVNSFINPEKNGETESKINEDSDLLINNSPVEQDTLTSPSANVVEPSDESTVDEDFFNTSQNSTVDATSKPKNSKTNRDKKANFLENIFNPDSMYNFRDNRNLLVNDIDIENSKLIFEMETQEMNIDYQTQKNKAADKKKKNLDCSKSKNNDLDSISFNNKNESRDNCESSTDKQNIIISNLERKQKSNNHFELNGETKINAYDVNIMQTKLNAYGNHCKGKNNIVCPKETVDVKLSTCLESEDRSLSDNLQEFNNCKSVVNNVLENSNESFFSALTQVNPKLKTDKPPSLMESPPNNFNNEVTQDNLTLGNNDLNKTSESFFEPATQINPALIKEKLLFRFSESGLNKVEESVPNSLDISPIKPHFVEDIKNTNMVEVRTVMSHQLGNSPISDLTCNSIKNERLKENIEQLSNEETKINIISNQFHALKGKEVFCMTAKYVPQQEDIRTEKGFVIQQNNSFENICCKTGYEENNSDNNSSVQHETNNILLTKQKSSVDCSNVSTLLANSPMVPEETLALSQKQNTKECNGQYECQPQGNIRNIQEISRIENNLTGTDMEICSTVASSVHLALEKINNVKSEHVVETNTHNIIKSKNNSDILVPTAGSQETTLNQSIIFENCCSYSTPIKPFNIKNNNDKDTIKKQGNEPSIETRKNTLAISDKNITGKSHPISATKHDKTNKSVNKQSLDPVLLKVKCIKTNIDDQSSTIHLNNENQHSFSGKNLTMKNKSIDSSKFIQSLSPLKSKTLTKEPDLDGKDHLDLNSYNNINGIQNIYGSNEYIKSVSNCESGPSNTLLKAKHSVKNIDVSTRVLRKSNEDKHSLTSSAEYQNKNEKFAQEKRKKKKSIRGCVINNNSCEKGLSPSNSKYDKQTKSVRKNHANINKEDTKKSTCNSNHLSKSVCLNDDKMLNKRTLRSGKQQTKESELVQSACFNNSITMNNQLNGRKKRKINEESVYTNVPHKKSKLAFQEIGQDSKKNCKRKLDENNKGKEFKIKHCALVHEENNTMFDSSKNKIKTKVYDKEGCCKPDLKTFNSRGLKNDISNDHCKHSSPMKQSVNVLIKEKECSREVAKRICKTSRDTKTNKADVQDCLFHDTAGDSISRTFSEMPSPRRSVKRRLQVLFTGLSNSILESNINKLGGEVVDCHDTCSVLVTDKVRRTVKFLCVLGLGKPIVSPEWIIQSWRCGKFLDPMSHLLKDAESELKYNFSLADTIKKAKIHPLLAGYTTYATGGVKLPPEDVKCIVESCGGLFLSAVPSIWTPKSIIFSHEDDKTIWRKLKVKRVTPPIVRIEMLLIGVLKHTIDIESHRIK